MKKKAQHEANKIKLYGLGEEHKALLQLVQQCRGHLYKKVKIAQGREAVPPNETPDQVQASLTERVNAIATNKRE